MTTNDLVWQRYSQLQQRLGRTHRLDGYSNGIERALDHLLSLVEKGNDLTKAPDVDLRIERAISSGARLHRSRAASLRKWIRQEDFSAPDHRADARIELERIGNSLTPSERQIFLESGYGYTAQEIATRHATSSVAIRVRLSRGRMKIGRLRRRPSGSIQNLSTSSARVKSAA